MAGDWIKMRADLLTHPKVVRMSSALKADRLRISGGLFAVWCLFDTHSVDGKLSGYTPEALDDLIGFPGFADAMQSISWLEFDGESLSTPRFEEHNGQSAKRRAQETERKREARKVSAPEADKKRTREEKRREEKKEKPASLFDTFYDAYPKKEARKDAEAAFAKLNPSEELLARMLSAVSTKRSSTDWTKDGGKFIPLPATWLRAERWNDQPLVTADDDLYRGAR